MPEKQNRYDEYSGENNMQWIKLEGGTEVFVNLKIKKYCKCGKEIVWATTKNNKSMPITINTNGKWFSHFADCPEANKFRKVL